ncbi:MAG: hypothetical protein LBB05_01865 [Puniceicoccales bacterium]|jgi:hypothetical protein|nr:hypothetical protein [Puniceicoccales bacterium]
MTDKFSDQEIEGICLIQIELAGMKKIAAKVQQGKSLTAAEWWYYMMENSEKFTENEIQRYQNVGMPSEITKALDKLKLSGWNYNDQKVYEGEVQEVVTYYGELERYEREGIQKGLQKGKQEEQIKNLIDRFLDGESLQKSLLRIEKNSIPKDLAEQVWNDYTQNQSVPKDHNLEDFVRILQNADVLQ